MRGAVASAIPSILGNSYSTVDPSSSTSHSTVLILGGGVSGIIAARTLQQYGVDDFKIIEARLELGGRLKSFSFGVPGNQYTLELGANWIQGTETLGGAVNPIWSLAQKHHIQTSYNDWYGSISTYDETGCVDYLDTFNDASKQFDDLTAAAGVRVQQELVDLSARSGYSLVGAKPKTLQARACEYYNLDWETADSPDKSSWITTSWVSNFTYVPAMGGFGDTNYMSLDQRGFKTFIQEEAAEFLNPYQVLLNSSVKSINYSTSGVEVVLADDQKLTSDYVLSTFSLGVLQNDDVLFDPPLPPWKQEAINTMTMGVYTKIFLQFREKFWFDTEMGLYADPERGRYPVWQSLDHVDFLPGSHILFATVTGDFAIRVEALSDAQVKDEVMEVLRTMFSNVTVPDPVAFHFPRWHSDPLYRGSYSNWPPSFFSDHHQNLQATVDHRLWFAGEHTNQKYFGFLHGAYFSGVDVGKAMSSCITGGGCVEYQHVDQVTNGRPYRV